MNQLQVLRSEVCVNTVGIIDKFDPQSTNTVVRVLALESGNNGSDYDRNEIDTTDPHIASKTSLEIKKINEMKEGHKDTNEEYDDYDCEGCNGSSTSSSTSSSYSPGFLYIDKMLVSHDSVNSFSCDNEVRGNDDNDLIEKIGFPIKAKRFPVRNQVRTQRFVNYFE